MNIPSRQPGALAAAERGGSTVDAAEARVLDATEAWLLDAAKAWLFDAAGLTWLLEAGG
jgi:hypothetical protein